MRPVPDYGPHSAPLLVVGEAGGKDEGAKGMPYQGAVGRRTRGMLRACGLDPEREVRYANVIPYEMATLPNAAHLWQGIVQQHWDAIDATLVRGEHKAVLVHGRAALWRLTGQTQITKQHGAVGVIDIGGRSVPLVASVHPASVMRSKIEAGWALVESATARACRYARGMPLNADVMMPPFEWDYTGGLVEAIHYRARERGMYVAIDCEFDRVTKRPFIIGVSVDGRKVATVAVNDKTLPRVRALCADPTVTKVLHHAPADVISLSTVDVHVRPPLFDTLTMYGLVYPDLPLGLDHVALHLFDDVFNWKGMGHDDPQYNAIDVVMTHRAFGVLAALFDALELWPVWKREMQHLSAMCMAQEARGLAVDPDRQRIEVEMRVKEASEIEARVKGTVDAMFAKRSAPLEAASAAACAAIAEIQSTVIVTKCVEHPKYVGLVKPRGKNAGECTCALIYEAMAGDRERVAALRKQRDKAKAPVKRWAATGFDLGNNDHLRWLLYDADGFKLSVQRNPRTKQPTASADAVNKLLTLKKVQETPLIRDTLVAIKRYQHLGKMVSTFLLWVDGKPSGAIDRQGFAHPEDRPFGPGTGRHAGGPEASMDDKKVNAYAYNALNIPEETRAIYVPHPEAFIVDAAAMDVEYVDEEDDDEEAYAAAKGDDIAAHQSWQRERKEATS